MFRTFLLVGASAMALAASSAGAVTFAYTGAAQSYTVAAAGIYKLQASGASGGASGGYDIGNNPVVYAGGYGAAVGRNVTVSANTSIGITVGGRGGSSAAKDGGGGGGGGTFIVSGNALLLAAGGGGGGGSDGFPLGTSPSSASLTTAGKDTFWNGSGGTRGHGGSVGTGAGFGASGGGAGFKSAGETNITAINNVGNGGGGGSAPAFMGGGGGADSSGSRAGNGGFGGGGGGGAGYSGPAGGGGGYSGGAGTTDGLDGGGGGSFGNDASFTAIANHVGNGSASIDAIRLFAAPKLSTNTLDFGIVRGGSVAQQQAVGGLTAQPRNVTVSNAVIAGPISDKLVTVLGSLPANITSSAPGLLAAGQSGVITYSLSTATAGLISVDTTIGFASHSTTGDDIALASSTLHITGTVTDRAVAVIVGKGDGLLTFKNGQYVLDLGDVAANSGVRSTLLSMLNGVTHSAYSETLHGLYSGLSSDGFHLALRNPSDVSSDGDPVRFLGDTGTVEGGDQSDLGLLGFDPSGLSLGLHSQTIDFYGYSGFGNLTPINDLDWLITVEANVTAGVPVADVPEPATWGLLTAGFGMIGAAMRRRKVVTV